MCCRNVLPEGIHARGGNRLLLTLQTFQQIQAGVDFRFICRRVRSGGFRLNDVQQAALRLTRRQMTVINRLQERSNIFFFWVAHKKASLHYMILHEKGKMG